MRSNHNPSSECNFRVDSKNNNIRPFNYYVYFIITVNTYLFKYVPVKLGFIILSIIGVLRIPEEFYLDKDKIGRAFGATKMFAYENRQMA